MHRFSRMAAGAAAIVALVPAVAEAAPAPTATTPTTTTTTPVPPTPPAPVVTQAKGKLTLALEGAFPIRSGPVTIARRAVRVNGIVRPYVAGQTVVLHAFIGHGLIKSVRVGVVRSRSGTYGHFSVRLASSHPGQVNVSVVHASTAQLQRLTAHTSYGALVPQAGFGSSGRFVQLIQSRLAALHLYLPQTGVYDGHTGLALDAYHRLLGRGTSQTLDGATIASLLAGRGTFKLRYPGQGRHAEGNLGKQVLALADGSKVVALYPISSGKPSTPTILGNFQVYSKVPGYLPDGMFFSNFFVRGFAIHGYDPAPDYPASHGCMRVPISDAYSIYNWLRYGDGVDVYY